jgi:hypothetical protein
MPILDFLARSGSSDEFRGAVEQFLSTGQPNSLLVFDFRCPPVKVERMLTKLLESHPELPIERVILEARSGCDFFRGHASVEAGERSMQVRFDWNCRRKAEELGWTDWFGLPDQGRAAREFGYDCFQTWDAEPTAATAA